MSLGEEDFRSFRLGMDPSYFSENLQEFLKVLEMFQLTYKLKTFHEKTLDKMNERLEKFKSSHEVFKMEYKHKKKIVRRIAMRIRYFMILITSFRALDIVIQEKKGAALGLERTTAALRSLKKRKMMSDAAYRAEYKSIAKIDSSDSSISFESE